MLQKDLVHLNVIAQDYLVLNTLYVTQTVDGTLLVMEAIIVVTHIVVMKVNIQYMVYD